ncbi:MAG: branched-chain amino acid transport system substrate-binding protein, livK [Syntrophus sp. SKADARSKE-3]|nr:branched-chain amino acid transport system substrate-binding protein, livK [Syntrophus sp. SKADARSKE-3]
MPSRTEKAYGVLIIVIMLSLIAGCGGDDKPMSHGKVKIGMLFPLSGELADKGKDSVNGVTLAAEEINASGGIAALGGAKLDLIAGDTRGNPDIGVQETGRLITDQGAVAIIGAYQSSVAKPASQVAERLETPFIISAAVADVITERGFRYTFRVLPKAQFYGRDQARFLADLGQLADYPVKQVALLHENTDFGTSVALAQKKALRDTGLNMIAEVSYVAEGATDLSKEVAQVLAAKPDAILEVTYLKDSILIRRAMTKAGATIPLVDSAGGTVSPEYIQTLKQSAEGTLTSSEYSKYTAEGKILNARFRARFGVDITGDSAYSYQAVWVIKDALERARSLDKKKLRQALAATDMPKGPHMILPAERLRFDAQGQNEFARLFIVQIQDGELVPVWPAEYAVAKVRLKKR